MKLDSFLISNLKELSQAHYYKSFFMSIMSDSTVLVWDYNAFYRSLLIYAAFLDKHARQVSA